MRLDKRWIWIFLALLTLAIRWVLSPEQMETYYSRGLFPLIRQSIDLVNQWVPFPLVYTFLLILLLVIGVMGYNWWQKKGGWLRKLGSAGFSLLSFAAALFFFFTWMWGFNYGRIALEDQLNLSLEPLSETDLSNQINALTIAMLADRYALPRADTQALDVSYVPVDLEEKLRYEMENLLEELGYPVKGRVRGRFLLPKGILLRFGSAGVYLPWTGEGHIDAGLHPLQWPFTLAHETAHGYGITDEGSCNFLAYLACSRSEHPFIRYSGRLGYWRYLAHAYRASVSDKVYADWRAGLPTGFRADLQAIYDNLDLYPDLMPQVRDFAYDNYLKAQGIEEGLQNYNRILLLVHAWEKSEAIE